MDYSKLTHPPMAHQKLWMELHGAAKGAALNAEMGTGKTYAITLNMIDLWLQGKVDSVLIFAPNGVHTNWTLRELPKMMPDWVDWKARSWPNKNTVGRMREWEQVYRQDRPGQLRIAAFNWEALQNKRSLEAAERFAEEAHNLMVICDESDNMKNPQSLRFKNMFKHIRPYSKFRRTMTGTPINNGPFDAFAQYRFLDVKFPGTDSFVAFKNEYAEIEQDKVEYTRKDGTKGTIDNPLLAKIRAGGARRTPVLVKRDKATGQPKYRNLDKLNRLLAPHTMRVLKKDCLDLPEKVPKQAFYELTPQQQKAYDLCKEEALLLYEQTESPIARLNISTKLSQITSGYYIHPLSTDDDKLVRIEGPTPKLDLMEDRVAAILAQGSKVIIWARYHVEIADIMTRLRDMPGAVPVQYHGKVKQDDRIAAIDLFQEGDANIFVGQQQAGGSGITLTAATYVVYFSNTFSLRDRLQSEDRAHRIGQRSNVTYLDLIARGTVDEQIVGALQSKKNVADEINGDNWAAALKGK